jgi:cell division protein FtsL
MLTTAPLDSARGRASSQPAPQRRPSAPPKRPPLRVVTEAELREAKRRARTRTSVLVGAVVFAITIFGVVVAHVLLIQGQFELDSLQRASAQRQAQYDRLRLQVAQLESPDRIVATAQQRLGMVSPPTITYLAPSADAVPAVATAPADASREVSAPAASPAQQSSRKHEAASTAPPANWSTVKPHLSEG